MNSRSTSSVLFSLLLLAGCSPAQHDAPLRSAARHLTAPEQINSPATDGTGTISGHVTDASHGNAPVPGVLVTALVFVPGGTYGESHHAITAADGSYQLSALPEADYLVVVRPALHDSFDVHNSLLAGQPIHPHFTALLPQIQNGADLTGTNMGTAPRFHLGAGAALTGRDFALRSDTRLSGGVVIREFGDQPVQGFHALAFTYFGGKLLIVSEASTDVSGHFKLTGIPNSSDIIEADITPTDTAYPTWGDMEDAIVHDVQFTGDVPQPDIHIEVGPPFASLFAFLPDGPVGATASDPSGDAAQGGGDITRVDITQLSNIACNGNLLHDPVGFKAEVVTRQSLNRKITYRLHILMTDNLALQGYTHHIIETTAGKHGDDNDDEDDSPGLNNGDSSNPGLLPDWTTGLGGTDKLDSPGDENHSIPGHHLADGFVTTGPALDTELDAHGDVREPGVSSISWLIDFPALGPLSGGGTGFYVYAEAIQGNGNGKNRDFAPNAPGNSKVPAPFLVRTHTANSSQICGRTGVI